jgi:alpha/beta superfamily hydrolase
VREDIVRFRSGQYEIEGLFHAGNAINGAVITHPHPLYGGDMANPVVAAIAAAYQTRGYATLRFNFRGTGRSTGTYDQGIGEQVDVTAAVAVMKSKGVREVHLSGYSFGAWINAMALQDTLAVQGMTMVAPPVAFIEFADGIRLPMLSAVVAGNRDAYAPPDRIRPLMSRWNPEARMDIVDGADHFFSGFLEDLTRILVDRIEPLPSQVG